MSEEMNEIPVAEEEAAPTGGGKKKLILLVLVVLLLVGGGGGAYFFFFRHSAAEEGEETAEAKDTGKKKSSKKKAVEEDEEEETPKDGKTSSASKSSLKSAIPSDEDVKSVIELQPFIVNLADEDQARYLRLSVSVGIGGEEGGKEEKASPIFITRVRNAMLAVLSVKSSEEVLTVEGKAKLRKELLKAAQAASEEPHVEAIYITDFIVQL
ncbi:MAG TPA: flagellar basal body-associated FliL family protein [Pyrinomonadaceae bacterium]|nr:flagellar basal body-associated FliL family protein [Pyrinomonadaceae bacterium]